MDVAGRPGAITGDAEGHKGLLEAVRFHQGWMQGSKLTQCIRDSSPVGV